MSHAIGRSLKMKSRVQMTDGLAHAGSHDVGMRLHDESKVAFRIMDDEAVEDTDKAKM